MCTTLFICLTGLLSVPLLNTEGRQRYFLDATWSSCMCERDREGEEEREREMCV